MNKRYGIGPMVKSIPTALGKLLNACDKCRGEFSTRRGWDYIDLCIWHDNGHVWPGFAGEPDGGNYGGSDF